MITIEPAVLKRAIAGKKVLVDTNIIIYLTDAIEPYEALSRLLMETVEKGEAFAVFCVLTVAEVMQGPLKKRDISTAREVREYLLNFPNTLCQNITADVLEQLGADDRVDWAKLRTMDSLIIASGLANDVDRIISNDRHFKEALPSDLILSLEGQ